MAEILLEEKELPPGPGVGPYGGKPESIGTQSGSHREDFADDPTVRGQVTGEVLRANATERLLTSLPAGLSSIPLSFDPWENRTQRRPEKASDASRREASKVPGPLAGSRCDLEYERSSGSDQRFCRFEDLVRLRSGKS